MSSVVIVLVPNNHAASQDPPCMNCSPGAVRWAARVPRTRPRCFQSTLRRRASPSSLVHDAASGASWPHHHCMVGCVSKRLAPPCLHRTSLDAPEPGKGRPHGFDSVATTAHLDGVHSRVDETRHGIASLPKPAHRCEVCSMADYVSKQLQTQT